MTADPDTSGGSPRCGREPRARARARSLDPLYKRSSADWPELQERIMPTASDCKPWTWKMELFGTVMEGYNQKAMSHTCGRAALAGWHVANLRNYLLHTPQYRMITRRPTYGASDATQKSVNTIQYCKYTSVISLLGVRLTDDTTATGKSESRKRPACAYLLREMIALIAVFRIQFSIHRM